MTFGELLRTVVTGVEFNEVAVEVVVSSTGCEAHLALRQRTEHVRKSGVAVILVDVPEQHSGHGVGTERAVVVEVELTVVAAVTGAATSVAQHGLSRIAHGRSGIGIRTVIILRITLHRVEVIVHVTVVGRARPVLEREHGVEAETLSDEVELLVEVEVGRDGAGKGVLITIDQTGQCVGVTTVGELTEAPVDPTVVIGILIHDGEEHRVRVHHLRVDIIHGVGYAGIVGHRTVHLVETRIEVERDLRRLRHIKVNVVLESQTGVVDVVVEGIEILTAVAQHTRLMTQVEVHEVDNLMRTATDIHVGFLVEGCVLEDFLIIKERVRFPFQQQAAQHSGRILAGFFFIDCQIRDRYTLISKRCSVRQMHGPFKAEGISQNMDRAGRYDTADLRQKAGTKKSIFRPQRHSPYARLQTLLTDQPSAGALHIFNRDHTGILRCPVCIPIAEGQCWHAFQTELLRHRLGMVEAAFIAGAYDHGLSRKGRCFRFIKSAEKAIIMGQEPDRRFHLQFRFHSIVYQFFQGFLSAGTHHFF